jgi:hypothetical protein
MIAHIQPTGIGWRVVVDDGEEIQTRQVGEILRWLEDNYSVPTFDLAPDGSGGFMTCVHRREEIVSA